ncbi:MAG TPA: DUF3500 domain-containing protein [Steroidobacteraceae bacterium]|nr:DUF3500 domain-containing protein [Steroidobacteraceae bacterium]
MRITSTLGAMVLATLLCAGGARAETCDNSNGGKVEPILAAVAELHAALTAPQRALLERPLTRESATRWSNLPVGVVPRTGLRLGDLDTAQAAVARRVFAAALSACGLKLLDDVRHADDFLIPLDQRPIGWDGRNYYLSVLGEPAARTPWMLQLGGHHLAYNFVFNGRQPGATPLFFGTEPIRFELQGVAYEPLDVQSTAMRNLATAIATHPNAKLSGTFTDVVKGVEVTMVPGQLPTGGTDTGFPHTYPTGTNDRGVPYSALTPVQQALVRTALRSYASLPGAAISQPLVAAYESAAALRETYVGYAGAPALSEKGSYVRIDGPRLWMEFVVQPAVAKPTENHYHALWRDKQSDYGGEVAP